MSQTTPRALFLCSCICALTFLATTPVRAEAKVKASQQPRARLMTSAAYTRDFDYSGVGASLRLTFPMAKTFSIGARTGLDVVFSFGEPPCLGSRACRAPQYYLPVDFVAGFEPRVRTSRISFPINLLAGMRFELGPQAQRRGPWYPTFGLELEAGLKVRMTERFSLALLPMIGMRYPTAYWPQLVFGARIGPEFSF